MSTRKKGLVEALSWKAIGSAIVSVLGLWFGIPEYVYNARPALEANIGTGPVCFLEGAITGASTVLLVLKLFSHFSSRAETTEKQGSNLRQLKKRIREELRTLRDQINLDLQSDNMQSRTYQMDAFQNLKAEDRKSVV